MYIVLGFQSVSGWLSVYWGISQSVDGSVYILLGF